MKIIEMKLEKGISYPVATDIIHNIEVIRKMAVFLDVLIKKPLSNKDRDVILWCRGSSGAIIAGVLAFLIPVERIIHVKKGGESCHETSYYVPSTKRCIHIFCDDFISKGDTMNAIFDVFVRDNPPNKVFCVCLGGSLSNDNVENLNFSPKYFICNEID